MSHKHTHKEKTKDELEAILETKEALAEAKAEMLEHNPILKLHGETINDNEENSAHVFENSSYIKSQEDSERIAQNDFDHVQESNPVTEPLLQSQIQDFFAFQMQCMSSFMESWSNLIGTFNQARR